MFKLIRTLVTLVVILAIVVLTYNYFAGTPAEKETSRRIAGQVKELVGSVFSVLAAEKDKFSEGKYDAAFDKLSNALSVAQENAASLIDGGQQWFEQLKDLERQKDELENQIRSMREQQGNPEGARSRSAAGAADVTSESTSVIDQRIRQLAEKTQRLVEQMYRPE